VTRRYSGRSQARRGDRHARPPPEAPRRTAPVLIAILPLLSAGEKIFSELTGPTSDRSGTGRGRGTFVGGTGRFEGITGSYEIDRVSVPSLDPVKIESRSLSMQGTWELP